ncbi:MAG: hypothetical protein PVH19_03395 [Planctomycetia bacterium]|jgi:tRNA(Met) C34 N-acetyltransferase TmcA
MIMKTNWESELATFMNDLLEVQSETLDMLAQRRQMLASADLDGLVGLGDHEQELVDRLQNCLARREELLDQAQQEGLASKNIKALTKSLPSDRRGNLKRQVFEASAKARLLKKQTLVNWVITQKTLIHLSQMLEIIATRGRGKPTYEKADQAATGGFLVNQEV